MRPNRVEWRRVFAIVTVLACLIGAGVANALVRASRDRAAAARPAVDSVVHTSAATASDAWYCPGPLPTGARPAGHAAAASVAIANVANVAVRGELVVSDALGDTTRRVVRVRARSQSLVALATTGRATFSAVSVLMDGAGVGVTEVVHGDAGVTDAPCVDHTASLQYLAAGGSRGANNVALALFDPGATPSVASVSFSIGSATVAPPAFQGLPVPAGGVVVLDVGHYLPQRAAFSANVTSVGGWIVAGESMSVLVQKTLLSQLVTASSTPTSTWWFGPAPGGPDVREAFAIANPNPRPARVALELTGAGPTVTRSVVVGPGAATVVSPVPALSAQALRFAQVTSASSTPVVVERETVVERAIPPRPRSGVRRRPKATGSPVTAKAWPSLGGLDPGYGLSAPVHAPVRTWLLPGGEADDSTGESVFVANPGTTDTTVEVTTLPGPSTDKAPVLARFSVAPGAAEVIDIGAVVVHAVTLPLVVSAPSPVLAGSLLYARGSSGSLGFSASIGIPED